jgi:putative AdoMet-dependent methyltransferase
MEMDENNKTWDFDNWADRYDEDIHNDQEYYARYDEILDMVVKVANTSPQKKVLDIGTGTGNLARRFLACSATVVGLDQSEKMLAVARKKIGNDPRVEFYRVPDAFLQIPYPDNSFDVVASTYAFHHIPHHAKSSAICEMLRRVLKPGGVLVLGDLMFKDEEAEKNASNQYEWLEEEYFERIDELRSIFKELLMKLDAQQFTPVAWVVWTVKEKVRIS